MAAVIGTFNSRLLKCPVHSLYLSMGPGMVRWSQTMVDAVGVADAVEQVGLP